MRELSIARALAQSPAGVQGIASSLCPIHTSFANGNPRDPLFGYRPAIGAIVDHLKVGLRFGCPALPLAGGGVSGAAQCSVFVTYTAASSPDEAVCDGVPELSRPPAGVLQSFQQARYLQWQQAGSPGGTAADPRNQPSCLLQQLTPAANPTDFQGGSCAAAADPGWCYITGGAGAACSQQIVLTPGEPPKQPGVVVQVLCGG
ncbi:MAG: hypothetical protein JOZ69_16680 [Myxococcales bacterium]|nr:hypothetical protein [Myxococcales bacterium]